ncbi:MAG: hypothetical protein A3E61_00035 [Candidatus Colwellbacteria bacterium RIFCSPHIGHO2_12_FULL_43_12]|uniref:Cell division protein FtsL n=3 Tax=Candidatus Colwelliibacteriota TaxID=1817904 RepID=A0A1G1Z0D1_9BACT|nr:MAG: hypothetical protein A3D47_02190 [Candidatus Colwellbacteria bacterium RIFCSPHIGHO2_02_FULL_43_15]OGY58909.1 MAG: hypothetical protein A3E61_00035 [Candidatus Colwellbacteria bacterium RIFCSPHIGHO2_12_FULL_43_12]OGY61317.1 MAG: hypothetical protein A3F99_02775 [Candidatus Colwellbacteria bacterium RIFCSPLOWO2_12_FULL_43_11]
MTVIQPNKIKSLTHLIFIFGFILVFMASLSVVFYSRTVSLRHDMATAQKEIDDMKVKNAELKNSFYSLVDSGELEKLATEKGLINDKNPQWEFASQY